VAITGSVGKTGTKDALGYVLSGQAKTTSSLGNLNNEWGAPLSLARMPADTAYGVFELGMSRAGEIAPLSRLMKPDVAVITTIAAVHMINFSSTFDIADAKAEIFEGMSAGVGVLHRENPYFPVLIAAACAAGIERVLSFGAHPEASARLTGVEGQDGGQKVTARIDGRRIEYRLSIPGRHWVMNSLAVLCAVVGLGADLAQAAEALAEVQAPVGRGRRSLIQLPTGELQLIDESYNASPAAVRAAIETLAGVTPGRGGRRIAVLGDMLELGPNSAAMHGALLETLTRSGIDLVFTTGHEMERLRDVLPPAMRGEHAATAGSLAPLVAAAVRAGDVVSVKGSRGIRTEQVVEALVALADPPRRAANHG
jgi:UDP-N-acetylmuramoyl-tripeptide--D-alanyl-D-alanine ligase